MKKFHPAFGILMTMVSCVETIVMDPQEELPAVLNQAFLYSLRGCLMNMELAAGQMRARAEKLARPAMGKGEEEKLHLLRVDPHIPAGAKLY